MNRNFRLYVLIVALASTLLVMSNISATKVVAFGPIIADGGALMFPLTYLIDDVLAEVYGYKYARQSIWISLGIMVLAVGFFTGVRYLPAWDESNQAAFATIFGFLPWVVVGSLAAFAVGTFVNATIVAKLKVKMQGRKMWVRLLFSTLVAELFDTTVFGLIAFHAMFTAGEMVKFILIGWLFKTAVEAVLMFWVTYPVIKWLKKFEGVDAYDTDTKFTPFKVSVNA